jgi:hypothetical protein
MLSEYKRVMVEIVVFVIMVAANCVESRQ